MKFFINIYYSFFKLIVRFKDQRAEVSLDFNHLDIQEIELKRKLTEDGNSFQSNVLTHCLEWGWKTCPLPLLKSSLHVYALFYLNFWERILFSFFPDLYLKSKKKYLRKEVENFIRISPKNQSLQQKEKGFFDKFFNTPKSIYLSSLLYKQLSLTPNSDFILADDYFLPLLFEGNLDCFVRIYRLQKIKYIWKSRVFATPEPWVGEFYLRVKDKYNNGSYGESNYNFQGRFLPVKKDQYLLAYWGLDPIENEALINMIPNEIFPATAKNQNEIKFIEEFKNKLVQNLSLQQVEELMKSDDQVSTSLRSHPE